MKQLKHYTANDIERYHSGQLSAAEMHALEKAAMDDPFLADALEGYVHTTTPAADLTSLQQRLQLRIEKEKKKRPVFYIGNQWLKIAALFILFAGGGWLVFQTLSPGNKTDIATTETTNKSLPPVVSKPVADTLTTVSEAPENSQAVTFKKTEKKERLPKKDVAVGNSVAATASTPTAALQQPEKEEAKEQQNNLQEVTALRQGYYIDSFSKSNPPTLPTAKVATKKLTADTVKNFDVVLQRTEVAADEVVVINKNNIPSTQPRRRMQVVIDSLEPAEGWTNFDDYIANNLRPPEEIKIRPVKGEVELLFEVNNQGEPVNITVLKSLCEKCDEEAIRLLKEGPKWKNRNKKKGKVKIKF